MENWTESKEQIRKRHLALRNEMEEGERSLLSQKISEYAKTLLDIPGNRGEEVKVYGYFPLGSEASLLSFYKYLLGEGVPLAFPRVQGMEMEFYQIFSLEDFHEGTFHVKEPDKGCPKVQWEQAVCIVPGVVFDFWGGRFGYGKGYYDRYLKAHPQIFRAGAAFGHQMEERLPTQPFDIPMDCVVTERGVHPAERNQNGISRTL